MKLPIYRLADRPFRLAAAVITLALAGGLAVTAEAGPPHAMGGPMMMMGGPGQVNHMLDAVKATDAQRSQIRAIMDTAHTDLQAQREAGRALKAQTLQIFTQPTVDANAAEAVRQQMLTLHDQVSRRMMQAMLDVSGVLTPEQRQMLGQRMAQRQTMMERHHAERQSLDKSTTN